MNTRKANRSRPALAMSGLVIGLFPTAVATNVVAPDGLAGARSTIATARAATDKAVGAMVAEGQSFADLWTMNFGR
jgi:hypothetical protein